jgi:hypothetical protein
MTGTHTTLSRLSRGVAVAASLVALTAPAALGAHDTWFTYATSTGGTTQFVTDTLAPGGATPATPGYRFVTDTLAPGGATAETPGYRFVTDTLAPGGGLVSSAPTATGFDWSDAGIGAASSVGLLLILLGGAQLVSRRRSVVAV